MDWCLYGDDKRKEMDRDLKPEYLLDDLRRYQDVFGEEFGVKELLMLEDIRVKAMIAGALADMPEFLIDQIGKASNSSNFPSMTRAMERIADVVEEKWEEERCAPQRRTEFRRQTYYSSGIQEHIGRSQIYSYQQTMSISWLTPFGCQ